MAETECQSEREVQLWIEAVTQEKFTLPFADQLQSGVTLSKLINKIQPGSVSRIEASSQPFKQMDNITNFLKACRALGVSSSECFETVDLFEQKNIGAVVSCLYSVGRKALTVPFFRGPHLKASTTLDEVPRINLGSAGIMERTQIFAGMDNTFGAKSAGNPTDSSVPRFNNASAGIMERPPISRSNDITFGRDSGTDGSPNNTTLTEKQIAQSAAVVPLFSMGSAGIMDRSRASTSNDINFGAKAAGKSADSSVPMFNKGSAGIMERSAICRAKDITFGRDAGTSGSTSPKTEKTGKTRTLTEQQIAQSAAVVPLFNMGSAGIMDRSRASTSNDINFGAKAAGKSADSSVPMFNKGSAGIMERSAICRAKDITFGRDAGTSGSTSPKTEETEETDEVSTTEEVEEVPPTEEVEEVPTTEEVEEFPPTEEVEEVPTTEEVEEVPTTEEVEEVPTAE